MSKYRDIVGFFQMDKMKFEDLHSAFLETLRMLHKLQFKVIAVVTDNLSTNQKLFRSLHNGFVSSPVPHPVSKEPLFLLFDTVHIFKNIYNGFQKAKFLTFPPLDGTGASTASFGYCKDLHIIPSKWLLKII